MGYARILTPHAGTISCAAGQVNHWLCVGGTALVEVALLDAPDRNVVARGSYLGGPDYEFVIAKDGHIDFRVVGDTETIWAGPSEEAFRRIAEAWNRYQDEVVRLPTEAAQLERVSAMRRELSELGALPADLPPDPEPLWSLLVFEAENGLG